MTPKKIQNLVEYAREEGFLSVDKVFVVWVVGPTDGWPQAICSTKQYAEHISNHYPTTKWGEGAYIEEVKTQDLFKAIRKII